MLEVSEHLREEIKKECKKRGMTYDAFLTELLINYRVTMEVLR